MELEVTHLSWCSLFVRWLMVLVLWVTYKWFKNVSLGPLSRFRVKFDWKEPCRVGKTVSFRVVIRKQSRGELEASQLLSQVRVEVKQNGEALNILSENVETDKECSLVIKFCCRRAGDCKISVTYGNGNQAIPDSPFLKKFLPGLFDFANSSFLRPGHTVYTTAHEKKFLALLAKDQFDNICRFEDLDMQDFQFTAKALVEVDEAYSPFHSHHFYPSGQRVGLKATIQLKGIFQCEVTYKGRCLSKGCFTMVVISEVERTLLDRILTNNPAWTYHEAKLLALGEEIQKTLKKIYIYVSPKQLYIRDYILRIFPIRVATFRVTNSTKIELQFTNSASRSYTYAIYDGIQPRVTLEMDETSARIVLAMFSHFLQRRLGGSESFSTKQKYFYEELRTSKSEARVTFCMLSIKRSDLVESSLHRTKHFGAKDWCKSFKIQFEGEEGIDAGGLRREWLNTVCRELFRNSKSGLFSSLGNSRLVHPNSTNKRNSKWSLKHYELAGKIVGKCLFESAHGDAYKQMVNGTFTRSFLAQILGLRPNYKHFEQDDPELFLGKIKFILDSEDLEGIELTFSEEEYSSSGKLLKVVDLIPNGSHISVTNENKEEYLNAMANYRLGRKIVKETESFLKGLHLIVPDDLLSNFDENELELLMCGKSEFDVKDLKQHHQDWCGTFNPQHRRVLNWFWTALENMSDEERAKLLQFVTGSSLLPHGGFKSLSPKFSIGLTSTFGQLPTAHTCVNQICLSDNSSFEEFERCLKTAIHEGSEGFAMR